MGGKIVASVLAWFAYLGMLWVTLPTLGTWMILFAFVLMMPLAVFMAMMWLGGDAFSNDDDKESKAKKTQEDTEKRKRERLENVLRDLSDEDLVRLKKRLSDGTINDGVLYDRMVGDDGELVDYR